MASAVINTLKQRLAENASLRPILTSLNGDNSWLISIPRPTAERRGKAYFHIVSDAWLTPDTVLFRAWVLKLGRQADAAIADGPAVENLIQEIEGAAAAACNAISAPADDGDIAPSQTSIDAIFQNFHYADHLDERTLRTFGPDVPVFATPEAAAIIRPWNHFCHVAQTRDLDPACPGTWRDLRPEGGALLPTWLSVFRLTGHHELNFATAIVWADAVSDAHEALLYSPHGIRVDQPALQAFAHNLDPPVRVLAMLHALKDSFAFGSRTTLGVAGGLALERQVRPKYWVKSHDAGLLYSGLIAWLAWINDITRSIEDGLAEEAGKSGVDAGMPKLVEVDNGDCFVLE
ncbi:hypothetical protein QBC34DRAFT_212361 [Podospora aff. communis PSN243]|uniref:Uncharacterized protein n=1 Tax=Podospora aff. communis PSN243 TaxID=3040156 RepID=A0AAV9G743_9PEZI|nr:hypothetical protein QBC34DRAFT_212361 [Podospora aff. communis PSN243]